MSMIFHFGVYLELLGFLQTNEKYVILSWYQIRYFKQNENCFEQKLNFALAGGGGNNLKHDDECNKSLVLHYKRTFNHFSNKNICISQ